MVVKLGDLLLKAKLVTQEQVDALIAKIPSVVGKLRTLVRR